ncbi:hypothetical protein F2Q69_00030487 [Brassica cretica]|uniref:Methyltransferase n=1 Tax=Brassica cretica TaxID=69181 RepID=A0A8S9RT03_BRACR|nr:hypothetical protein F2Q69_00030487 [Brassica cretica]
MKNGKQSSQPEKGSSRILSLTVLFIALCGFSFYLGGMFCSERVKIEANDVTSATTKAVASPMKPTVSPLQIKSVSFPECSSELQDYTPCTDPKRWKRYGVHRLSFLERHCPPVYEKNECLIPPPDGYKPPIRWPKSRDQCWYKNVPYDWINKQKSNQHWLKKEGDKFHFPGGGTMFPHNHEAQVQFALERGIPAILGVISTQRLPFPSNSFDMAHCSRCLIPWTEFGGIYLLEIHRIVRPGGFWVLSGPPVNYNRRWRGWNTTMEDQKSDYNKLQSLLTSMCFKKYAQKDDIAVWQKLSDKSCYDKIAKNMEAYPPKCDDSIEPDSAWYTPLRPCVVAPTAKVKNSGLGSIPKWPERLNVAPERISDVHGGSASGLKHDDGKWKSRVKHYKNVLPALGTDKIRNVMDMNTVYGGFAAALVKDPVWVMNVVSSHSANTLPVVFDRGLIGTYHDWCEAFSTYPRTYDLLHLDSLFTLESHRCEMKYVLLEMDRILRPGGYVIMRESSYFMDAITMLAKGTRWNCRREETEYAVESEKILVCQKKLWFSSNQTS